MLLSDLDELVDAHKENYGCPMDRDEDGAKVRRSYRADQWLCATCWGVVFTGMELMELRAKGEEA